MEDELDVVDIEGDECDAKESDLTGALILQDQYLQSAWRTDSYVLPWTLDSSISDENREVIESMLLEEQYYFSGKKDSKTVWLDDKLNIKKSPMRSTAAPARWTQEEKDLFDKGLAQFGRRWTKIAKLIGTRTVLQVKSYARQYFKNKAKAEVPAEVSSAKPQSSVLHHPPSSSSPSSVQSQTPLFATAVRIERLSDDEDVDITDDLSDDASQFEHKAGDFGDEHKGEMSDESAEEITPVSSSSHLHTATEPASEKQEVAYCALPSPNIHLLPKNENALAAQDNVGNSALDETEEDQGDDEELKAPEQEVMLDTGIITEEEKQAIPEFFEGRPSKTPERYLKIRNYILDQWENSKPKYLNKTSVRPGLKNCGDVNCIGRIHTYLELIGAINFNCEQAIYNRPRPLDRSRLKESRSRDSLEAYQLAQRLQSMRTRKRRVRDAWGNWCDARDLEGQTYEHLTADELALRRDEIRKRQTKPCKFSKQQGSFDPFQLIQCKDFGEETQEPFKVLVSVEALVVMDVHSHVSMGEVIGLLGGSYDDEAKVLRISTAEPCNSLSTGLQCEMDPVSQTQASELLSDKGHRVVGWYHSHPAFDPNPSLRDIDTQAKYQSYFSRGGSPFIGMIVSPYNPSNSSPVSQNTCLLVQEDTAPANPQKLPYKFEYQVTTESPDWTEVMRRTEWVVFKYRKSYGCVPMKRLYRRNSSLTCLEKMLTSLRKILTGIPDTETYLDQIETMFITDFIDKQSATQAPGSSSYLHDQLGQSPLDTFTIFEPTNSNRDMDFEKRYLTGEQPITETDSPDEGLKSSSAGIQIKPNNDVNVLLRQTGSTKTNLP